MKTVITTVTTFFRLDRSTAKSAVRSTMLFGPALRVEHGSSSESVRNKAMR